MEACPEALERSALSVGQKVQTGSCVCGAQGLAGQLSPTIHAKVFLLRKTIWKLKPLGACV